METVTLERMKFAALMYISEELAKDFAIEPQVTISSHTSFMYDQIIMRIRQDIFGKQLDKVEIRYPADWWQSFKKRFFPDWLLSRYPVNEEIKIIDIILLYPTVNVPGHEAIMYVDEQTQYSKWHDSILARDGRVEK